MAGNQNLVAKIIINAQDNASKAFKAITDNLGKITTAVAFKSVIDGAADFELQLDKVAAKGGYTATEMDKIKQSATSFASTLGVSGFEAAQGLEVLAAAGLKSSDAISILPSVLGLARSESVSMDVAATKMTDTMSIMGLGFDQSARAADVLTKAANISKTSAIGIAESIKYAGGIAKASGYSFEQTAAMIDLLAEKGIKGEQAGTGLRSVLTSLKDPSSTASKELDKLGISTRDVGGVMDALKSKGKAANAAILGFGQEGAPAVYAFMDQGSAKIKEFTGELQKAGGAAAETSQKMGDNFDGAKRRINATYENLRDLLGTPILKPLANSFDDLSKQFQQLYSSGVIDKIGQSLADVFKAGSEWAVEFVKKTDFTAIGENIKTFATNVSATFDEIGSKVKSAGDVVNFVTGVFSAGFNTIQAAAGVLESGITGAFGSIKSVLGDLKIDIGEFVKTLPGFEEVGNKYIKSGEALKLAGENIKSAASTLYENAGKDLYEAGVAADKVQTAFKNLGDSASDSVPKLDKIWGVSEKLRETLGGIESKEISITADSRDAQDKVDHLKKPTEHTHTAIPDTRDAEHAKANLTTPTFSTHFVNVSYTDNGNGTANVGGRTVYHESGSNYWGDRPRGYSVGGAIDFKRRKGKLDGYGGGDTVPAYLEAGEFIMRKEAVAMYGTDFMAQINNTKVDSTLPAIKIPRGDDDVLLPIQKFQTGGLVGIQAALSSAKTRQQFADKDLYLAESDFNEWVRSGRATESASIVGYTNRFNAAKTAAQAAKANVDEIQKQYDETVKKETEQQKAAQENARVEAEKPQPQTTQIEKLKRAALEIKDAAYYRRIEQQKAAQQKAAHDAEMLRLYPEKYDPNYQEKKNIEKVTPEKVTDPYRESVTFGGGSDEIRNKDLYKQKEEGFKLADDEVGLEKLRYEREKLDLKGNQKALAQAEKNHQAKLAEIEKKAREEAEKETYKQKEDSFKLADDEVGLEKLRYEKEQKDLAGNKEAFAQAKKNHQAKLAEIEKKAREEAEKETYKQKEEGFKLAGDEVGLEKLRYEKEQKDLAGNKEAFAQAEKNHQAKLAEIEKKAREEAEKETYKQKEEGFKLAGDEVGLEKLRYEKEQKDLAGNKEALAQAEKNNKLRLAQIQAEKQQEKISRFKEFEQKVKAQEQENARKREQSKQTELEQRLESARLDGNEIEAENIRYQQELSKIDRYDARAAFYLKENHEKRLAQIIKAQSGATQATQSLGTESFTAQETQKTTPTQSNQVITIRFESGGRAAQGQFSQNDANAVVEILRNAAASGLPASFIR